MAPVRRFVAYSGLALVVLLGVHLLVTDAGPTGEIRIAGYGQSAQSLVLTFDRRPAAVTYAILPDVPPYLDVATLPDDVQKAARLSGQGTEISLAGEPTDHVYSLVVMVDGKWFELVRQPATWLADRYGFEREGGYSILGRRSIEVGSQGEMELPPLEFTGKPQLGELGPSRSFDYPEVSKASALLAFLWSQPIRQGPISEPYDAFLRKSFADKLRDIREGRFAVMCQGIRDLFVHASAGVPGLKVRAVEAFNYAPQLPDLAAYSHSTAEIWVESLGRWVLFDPWFGFTIESGGVPVGAAELHNGLDHAADFVAVSMIDRTSRYYRTGDGEQILNVVAPSEVAIANFSCPSQSCSPSYVEYFRNIAVRGYRIVAE